MSRYLRLNSECFILYMYRFLVLITAVNDCKFSMLFRVVVYLTWFKFFTWPNC